MQESTHRQREEVSRDQVRDAGSKLRTAEQMIDALRQHVRVDERVAFLFFSFPFFSFCVAVGLGPVWCYFVFIG